MLSHDRRTERPGVRIWKMMSGGVAKAFLWNLGPCGAVKKSKGIIFSVA